MLKQLQIIILLNCAFAFSQQKVTKDCIIDENKKIIDSRTFKITLNDGKHWYKTIETDTAKIIKLFPIEKYGKFKDDTKKAILTALLNSSGITVNDDEIVIINFFTKPKENPNGSCIDHYTSDAAFKNYTSKKRNKIKQFFVVQQDYFYDKNPVYIDKDGVIEKLIFEDGYGCGNYIIIKPTGNYYIRLGEYRQDKIKDIVFEKW